MNNKPLISVVVPVYNVEQYLDRCVNSILRQTYENLEIILVDDGSTDSCGEKCDEYALYDKRLRVIHKTNGGLSDARNVGTDAAKGLYITYVDSDDWVTLDYIDVLYSILVEYRADIAVCDLYKTDKDKLSLSVKKRVVKEYDNVSALEEMLYQTSFGNEACGKLYYTALMKKIRFPVGRLYEDLFTTYKLIMASNRIVYINAPNYIYMINNDSIMHQSFNTKMYDEIDAIDEIVDYVEKNVPQKVKAAYARKFSSYSQVIRWIPDNTDEANLKIRNDLWEFIKTYKTQMIFDGRARMKNRLAGIVAFMGMRVYKWM